MLVVGGVRKILKEGTTLVSEMSTVVSDWRFNSVSTEPSIEVAKLNKETSLYVYEIC